jgi:hypothetical protein
LSKNLLPKPEGKRRVGFARRRRDLTKLAPQGLPPAATVKKRKFFQVAAVSRPACAADAQCAVIFSRKREPPKKKPQGIFSQSEKKALPGLISIFWQRQKKLIKPTH